MNYCCEVMRHHADQLCPEHGYDCPERVIARSPNGDFYLPVRDGGDSFIVINHCPWCGTRFKAMPPEPDEFDQLLEASSLGSMLRARSLAFGRVTMDGQDLSPEGSWLLTEAHGGKVTNLIALTTAEAAALGRDILDKTAS